MKRTQIKQKISEASPRRKEHTAARATTDTGIHGNDAELHLQN